MPRATVPEAEAKLGDLKHVQTSLGPRREAAFCPARASLQARLELDP